MSNIIQFQDDMKLMYYNKLNEKENWLAEKRVDNCSEDELKQANLRTWRSDEIVLDIEDKEGEEQTKIKANEVRNKLIQEKINFIEIESFRNEGRHFHLFYSVLDTLEENLKKEVRRLIIKKYNADEKALGKYTTIENRRHFKGNKICKVISGKFLDNILDSKIIAEAKNITKQISEINILKEAETSFKDYFEKDELINFLYTLATNGEIIPDGTARHMVLLKNIAIAAVKSGKPGKYIDDIMGPLITKVMPGKSLKDLQTWIKTVKRSGDKFANYNYWEINNWTQYYYGKEIYSLFQEIEKLKELKRKDNNVYEIYQLINSYIWAEIVDLEEKYLKPIIKIEDTLTQKFLLNMLAFKSGIKQKDLVDKIRDIKENEMVENPCSILEIMENTVIKKIEYFIDPILPKGVIIALGGKAGQFKTNLMLSLIVSVLQNKGNAYLDKFENKSEENTKILYYDLETGKENIIRRFNTLLKGLNLDKKCLKNFHYVEKFSKHRLDIELINAMKHDIIVLDSYRRFLKDSENDSETTNQFYYDFLKPLKDAGKTVILLHHFKKIKFETFAEDELLDAFRGSGDIGAQLDLAYSIFKSDDVIEGHTTTFTVDLRKAKNRLGLPIRNFKMQVIKDDERDESHIKFVEFLTGGKGVVKPKTVYKDFIVSLIKEQNMSRQDIVEQCIAKYNISENSVYKYLTELISKNQIWQPKFGVYAYVDNNEQKTL